MKSHRTDIEGNAHYRDTVATLEGHSTYINQFLNQYFGKKNLTLL